MRGRGGIAGEGGVIVSILILVTAHAKTTAGYMDDQLVVTRMVRVAGSSRRGMVGGVEELGGGGE